MMGMADEFPQQNTGFYARPGLPGDDWNGGRGGDRGPDGPAGNLEAKQKMPWYVQHNMRQERRKQKGKHQ